MDFDSNEMKSEFNMAVSYLNRLNSLFYICDNSSMELDIYTWFNSLLTIFREISTEIKAPEKEEKNNEIKKLFEKVNDFTRQYNRNPVSNCPPGLYWELHSFELYLREICKKSGLQMRYGDDATNALK